MERLCERIGQIPCQFVAFRQGRRLSPNNHGALPPNLTSVQTGGETLGDGRPSIVLETLKPDLRDWAVVCLCAALRVQLFAIAGNGWPHNAPRYH